MYSILAHSVFHTVNTFDVTHSRSTGSTVETFVTVRKVTHPPLRQPLAGSALLPCVFTLSHDLSQGHSPYIHWTRGSGDRERTILSARDGVVRVHQAYAGRVNLPGYSANPLNASLELSHLRSNDSGIFRCHVALGDKYEQDTVNLEITGVVFHYRSLTDRYSLSYEDAVRACKQNSGNIATPEQLWAAFHSGMNSCAAGWLKDQTVRYPTQRPELGCYGHTEYSRGVRNYGKRDPSELFDVYCFANETHGEVIPVSVPDKLTHSEAAAHCQVLGGGLATVGQLYLSWTSGLEHCEGGWLADGSVRSSVSSGCAGAEPGVRTVTPAELIDEAARFDAYCYQETKSQKALTSIVKSLLKPWRYMTGDEDDSQPNPKSSSVKHTSSGVQELSDLQPCNWTGQVDLDKELHVAAEPPELSTEYLTVRLRAEDTSLDWSGQLDSFPFGKQTITGLASDLVSESPGGSAREEEDEEEGLSGQSVTTAPSSETTQGKAKSSFTNIVGTLWKPWSYLKGSETEMTSKSTAATKTLKTNIKPTAASGSELMSWWGSSWLSGTSSVTEKSIISHQPVTSSVPANVTEDGSNISRPAQTRQNTPVTREEWVLVTEMPGRKAETPVLTSETEEDVQVSRSTEPVQFLSLTESFSGESRGSEIEGSSWGDTYLLSQKTYTVVTLSTSSLTERSATTMLNRDDAMEARGEIQYRRKNKSRRPSHSTTEMTTTVTQSTTVSSGSANRGTTITTSPNESQMATPAVSITEKDLNVTDKDLKVTEKDLSVTARDLSVTAKDVSVTEKDLNVLEKDLSMTNKNISITEKDLNITGKNISDTEKDLSVTEIDLSVTETDLSITEKDLSVTEKDLNSTEKYLNITEIILNNGSIGETGVDRCSCLHGGTCLPHGEGFRCLCPQAYSGESCEIDVDDCQSNPCENGGTCIDKEDSFVCLCLPSYSGDRCERDTEGCEHSWKKFHGHCYRLFPRRQTWEDSEKDCREHSSHLTSITSSMEQDFLNGLGHENVWIGLNDRTVEEDFQWTDGLDVAYENWRENQPDNFFAGGEDCTVMISREDGKWNDVPCNYNLPYICKKGTVMCSTPPAVDNTYLVGRRRSHYDIHAVVRYQCDDEFFQRHVPTVRCRPNGTWERPKIICTKSRRSHRYRRQHHRSHCEHQRHRRHGSSNRGRD
ncbi:Neurocan core protein [Triplophysa tibetana]|uniref:Neurocan core protein n=1 Tax=Triplophysa tibetana TaxID=1572043 RepID=A0A5A9PBG9_9TELE|nr:Neurocan core protein [Triplophysa tibetana]